MATFARGEKTPLLQGIEAEEASLKESTQTTVLFRLFGKKIEGHEEELKSTAVKILKICLLIVLFVTLLALCGYAFLVIRWITAENVLDQELSLLIVSFTIDFVLLIGIVLFVCLLKSSVVVRHEVFGDPNAEIVAERLRDENATLNAKLSDAQTKIGKSETENTALRARIQELEAALAKPVENGELMAAKAEVEKLTLENRTLNAKLKKSKKDVLAASRSAQKKTNLRTISNTHGGTESDDDEEDDEMFVFERVRSDAMSVLQRHIMDHPEDVAGAEEIIKANPDVVKTVDSRGRTALHYAACNDKCSPAMVEMLLANGASPKTTDFNGDTPLHGVAAMKGNDERSTTIARMLIDKGASVDADNSTYNTPLHNAAKSGNIDIVQMCVERKPSCVNFVNGRGETALHLSMNIPVDAMQVKAVNSLVDAGANTTMRNKKNETALHIAVRQKKNDFVAILVKRGGVDAKNSTGETSLYVASHVGNTEGAKILLESGADPNLKNDEGWASLHAAASMGHVDCIRALLDKGADINMLDGQGTTPLFHACYNHRHAAAAELLQRGADVNHSVSGGWKPIHAACMKNDKEMIRLLLDFKTDLACPSPENNGYLPIHILCAQKEPKIEIINMLLEAGADVNAKSAAGPESTPLQLVAYFNHVEVTEYFLRNPDVNIMATNRFERTALQVACDHGAEATAILIAKHMDVPVPRIHRAKSQVFSRPVTPEKPSNPRRRSSAAPPPLSGL